MKKIISIIFSLSFLLIAIPQIAFGANIRDAFTNMLGKFSTPAGYEDQRTVEPIINNTIAVIMSFLGVIFLGLMLYGGFVWMTAQGEQARVKLAKDLITTAVIGIIIVIASYAITMFVLGRFKSNLIT